MNCLRKLKFLLGRNVNSLIRTGPLNNDNLFSTTLFAVPLGREEKDISENVPLLHRTALGLQSYCDCGTNG